MTTLLKPYLIGETAYHHEGDVDFLSNTGIIPQETPAIVKN